MGNINDRDLYPSEPNLSPTDDMIGTRASDGKTVVYQFVDITKAGEVPASNTVTFEKDTVMGRSLTALTGDLILSDTNIKAGSTAIIYHKQTTAPAINYGNLTQGSPDIGQYEATTPATLNIIFIMYTTGSDVEVTYRTPNIIIPTEDYANDAAASADTNLAIGRFYYVSAEDNKARIKLS